MSSPLPPAQRSIRPAARLLLGLAALAFLLPASRADEDEITAVAARAADDYVRVKRPDGTFEPEHYAFGKGGHWSETTQDDTIDQVTFNQVATTIAPALAGQNYLPSREPADTKFLIMVYWGTTASAGGASGSVAYQNLQHAQTIQPPPPPPPTNGAPSTGGSGNDSTPMLDSMLALVSMENRQRDRQTARNAQILGYEAEMIAQRGHDHGALATRKQDLIDELEDGRYFVVLMAYDFPLLLKEKKHKLVWETRFSIRQRHNDFGRSLASMAAEAARYFGHDTHGVVRKPLREGTVKLQELKILGVEPEK